MSVESCWDMYTSHVLLYLCCNVMHGLQKYCYLLSATQCSTWVSLYWSCTCDGTRLSQFYCFGVIGNERNIIDFYGASRIAQARSGLEKCY